LTYCHKLNLFKMDENRYKLSRLSDSKNSQVLSVWWFPRNKIRFDTFWTYLVYFYHVWNVLFLNTEIARVIHFDNKKTGNYQQFQSSNLIKLFHVYIILKSMTGENFMCFWMIVFRITVNKKTFNLWRSDVSTIKKIMFW